MTKSNQLYWPFGSASECELCNIVLSILQWQVFYRDKRIRTFGLQIKLCLNKRGRFLNDYKSFIFKQNFSNFTQDVTFSVENVKNVMS